MKLEKLFSVENASFEARRSFMSRLIGPTDTKAKNPQTFIDGVISGAELVKRTTDPSLVDVPRGYIPGLIKITELICKGDGCFGNDQRNYSLNHIKNKNTYIYYLDDDNIINPKLYSLIKIIRNNKIYTFNQENRLIGNKIEVNKIDTAMFLIDYNICKNIRWKSNIYSADFYYINDCLKNNYSKWVYVNESLCYYNKLSNINK